VGAPGEATERRRNSWPATTRPECGTLRLLVDPTAPHSTRVRGPQAGLENASCQRTLWPGGTQFELIRFDRNRAGGPDFTDAEFES
jgi:hypothetical protein